MPCGCKSCFAKARGFEVPRGSSFAGDFSCRLAATACVDPNVLFNADFTTPVTQPFPSSSAEMTALGVPAPTSIFLLDETGGANFADRVASNDLTPQGLATSEAWQNQRAIGLFDGTDLYSKRCFETEQASTGSADAANNTIFDVDGSTSIAFFVLFKSVLGDAPTGSPLILQKRGPNPYPGYELRFDVTGAGVLDWRVDIGAPAPTECTVALDHRDGAWHGALAILDWNANSQALYTDLGNTSVVPPAGSPSNTGIFSIGQGILANAPGLQYAYLAVWVGANAEGMGAADFALLFRHATDPTGLLTTASHASLLGDVVAEAPSFGTSLCEYSSSQVPLGYNANLTNSLKMGLRCSPAVTNLLTNSDDGRVAPWLRVNVGVTGTPSERNDSPRGMREAYRFRATAANGYIYQAFATAASTEYTIAVFVKRHTLMAVDVPGRLVFYDVSGGAELASQAFTATSEWQRVSLTATTNVGQVNSQIRIEITTQNDYFTFFRASACLGPYAPPIYAFGGAATQALTDFRIAGVAGQYLRSLQGEMDIVYASDVDNTPGFQRHHYYADGGAAPNRHRSLTNAIRQPLWAVNNSAGVAHSTFTGAAADQSVEHDIRHLWNSVNPLSGGIHVFGVDNGVSYNSGAGSYTATETVTTIHIGQDGAANNQLRGLLATMTCYDGPRCATIDLLV